MSQTTEIRPRLLNVIIFLQFYLDFTRFTSVPQLTLFTELSGVAGQAEAGEGADSIQTGGSVQTRVRLALINICRHTTAALLSHCIHLSVRGQYGGFKECVCVPVSQSCPVYPGAHTQIFCPFLL